LGAPDSSGNLTVTLDALTGINAGDTVSFRKFEASSTLIALTGAADAAGEFIDGTATNGATLVVNDTAGAIKVGQKVYNGTTDTGLTVASVATASATRAVTLTAGATAFAATNVIRFSSALSSASTTADLTTAIQNNIAERASLGAWQNRLNYIVDNMQTLSNNLADAQSRIVDTDYASETAKLTRGQILQQAATSMLAQANQMPNVILTLLK
jgi:flagellin